MPRIVEVTLPTLHTDQVRAFRTREDARGGDWARNAGGRRMAIRCGRRWGKTTYAGCRAADGAIKGQSIFWGAPDYKKLSEAYEEIKRTLGPLVERSSKIDGVIRTTTGGRIDFWTLNDEGAGRSRFYHGAIIDEGAFTKDGPLEDATSMLSIWEKSIEPTLFDYQGWALVASNTNGVNPENFLYAICNDPKWGFIEYHAPTSANPLIPMRLPGETEESHAARRLAAIEQIKAGKHPLVWAQEYEAAFVDWSGVAFFDPDKWLVDGRPIEQPTVCDSVFAVMDTATKTGSGNDGTAVTYWARTRHSPYPLVLLDWDLVQLEGATLITWLPAILQNLEQFARQCRARMGSVGAFVEDKDSGQVLLQQARNMSPPLQTRPIEPKLTALGKDGRALAISGHHYRGAVKMSRPAYEKVTTFKGTTRNHLVSQVTSFRIGDKDAARRADDALDAYTYGVALALGDAEGM